MCIQLLSQKPETISNVMSSETNEIENEEENEEEKLHELPPNSSSSSTPGQDVEMKDESKKKAGSADPILEEGDENLLISAKKQI